MSRAAVRYAGVQAKRAPVQLDAENDVGTIEEVAPLGGGGQSMPEPVQAKMEASFGTDFSGVRIHTDSPQAESIGALAYTQGSDIAFAPGQYQPETQSGQELLGHELTHVAQQASGRVADPAAGASPVNEDSALESEADEMGARAARGDVAEVKGKGQGTQPKRGGPIQALFGRKTKAAAKGGAVNFGKGIVNVFFPVFAAYDMIKNIDEGLSKDNPLYGDSKAANGALGTLIVMKEVGQFVAAAATVFATVLAIASIAQPAIAAAAAVAGLVATIAHAVTFVLRGLLVGGISMRIKSLKKAGEVEQVRQLEKQRWGEVGGMIGNGLGVVFGGIGLSGMWANAVKPLGDSGGNAMSAGFGQIGNSLADVSGGVTDGAGGVSADNAAARRNARPAPADLAPPGDLENADPPDPAQLAQLVELADMIQGGADQRQRAPSLVVDGELAGDLAGRLDDVQAQGGELGGAAAQLEAVDPADVERGNADAIGEDQAAAAEAAADVAAEGGGPAPEENAEAAPAERRDEEEDAAPAVEQAEAPAPNAPPPSPEAERRRRDSDIMPNVNPLAPQTRERANSMPVMRKASPVQKKGGWFRKRVLGRIKKALARAKQKFITKMAKLFGLDVKAAAAKGEVAAEAGKAGGALAAEGGAKDAAADAARIAAELKKQASSGS